MTQSTGITPAAAPDVAGLAELTAKRSAVDASGQLKNVPIDGVIFRPTRPVRTRMAI